MTPSIFSCAAASLVMSRFPRPSSDDYWHWTDYSANPWRQRIRPQARKGRSTATWDLTIFRFFQWGFQWNLFAKHQLVPSSVQKVRNVRNDTPAGLELAVEIEKTARGMVFLGGLSMSTFNSSGETRIAHRSVVWRKLSRPDGRCSIASRTTQSSGRSRLLRSLSAAR